MMTPMTITLDWIGAPMTVDGYQVSKHFGTHRTQFGHRWQLTHLRSGRSVPDSHRATAIACRVLAAKLERLRCLNWHHLTALTSITQAQRIKILDITAKHRRIN